MDKLTCQVNQSRRVRGDAALVFGSTGHSLTLNLAVETGMSDGALRSIILDRRQALAAL